MVSGVRDMISGGAHLGQSARLVGADDRHGAETLDGLERLAEDLVLAHHVGTDGHAGCNGDGEAFGDEGDGDGDAGYDEVGDVDPAGMLAAQPGSPEKSGVSLRSRYQGLERDLPNYDHGKDHHNHDGADDEDKVEDLPLQRSKALLGLAGKLGDAAEDGAVSCGDNNTGAGAGDAVGALKTDGAGLEVVVIGRLDGGGKGDRFAWIPDVSVGQAEEGLGRTHPSG